VYLTSCPLAADPPPDYGFTACAPTDGGIPPWSPDMSGRVVRDATFAVTSGKQKVTITLSSSDYAKLATDGSALISFETPSDAVQAFFIPLSGAAQAGS
jgi:hypothetical protein